MKLLLSFFVTVVLITCSSMTIAQPTVELIWRSTTGSGTPGGNSISAEVGDELVLDILVNLSSAGTVGANLSLQWGSGITGYSALECPAPPNVSAGLCVDSEGLVFMSSVPGVDETVGRAEGFDAATTEFDPITDPCCFQLPVPGFFSETMYLGSIEFVVEETPETIEVFYPNSISGITPDGFHFDTPEATAMIVPPCVGCGCPP